MNQKIITKNDEGVVIYEEEYAWCNKKFAKDTFCLIILIKRGSVNL